MRVDEASKAWPGTSAAALAERRDPLGATGVGGDGPAFELLLDRAGAGDSDAARARASAEELVAGALVLPVLKMLRSSNTASAPFAPGAYEKQFAPLFDRQMARRLVRAHGFDLVDAVAQRLERPAKGGGS